MSEPPAPYRTGGAALQAAMDALRRGDFGAVEAALGVARQEPACLADARLIESRAAQLCGDFDDMLRAADAAVAADDSRWDSRFRLLECLLYCGRADRVRAALPAWRGDAVQAGDHRALARLAEFHVHCLDHDGALDCLADAMELEPDAPDYLFARSASELALGRLGAAEGTLDRVIGLRPTDSDAWRNRSTLRRQTPERNHVAALEERLRRDGGRRGAEAQLCYALAKEYEDLGDNETSFRYLARGAAARRRGLSYRVEHDLAVIDSIRRTFDAELIAGASRGSDEPGPLFVLGLPRSGTTLVERILAAHSDVDSLGEINDFAYGLMHLAGGGPGKQDLVARAATLDFAALGARYRRATRYYGRKAAWLIDKTPLNYLYLGLIRLALPGARIVHVHRAPMDSCYGMYRTLFRAGYPFSYDLDDLGRYYIAWHGLMDHWRSVLGERGGFHELSYEALVANQAGETRALLDYCGLDWQDACLKFHAQPGAVATASAAQVRQPVYRDAIARWRRYEKQLEPLAARLQDAGIGIGANA